MALNVERKVDSTGAHVFIFLFLSINRSQLPIGRGLIFLWEVRSERWKGKWEKEKEKSKEQIEQ